MAFYAIYSYLCYIEVFPIVAIFYNCLLIELPRAMAFFYQILLVSKIGLPIF